jgi:hypothetical protein
MGIKIYVHMAITASSKQDIIKDHSLFITRLTKKKLYLYVPRPL